MSEYQIAAAAGVLLAACIGFVVGRITTPVRRARVPVVKVRTSVEIGGERRA